MSRVVSYLKKEKARRLLSTFRTFAIESRVLYNIDPIPYYEMIDEVGTMVPSFKAPSARQKRKLFMAPRFTKKSAIVRAFMVYLMLRFPNVAMTLYRATQDMAKNMLAAVQDTLTTNEVILDVFGDLSVDAPLWTTTKLTIPTRQETRVDPTLQVSGIRTAMAGAHPDAAFLDDIVTEVNCDSVADMETATNLITSQYPLVPPYGIILVSATRWSDIDAYGKILDLNADLVERGKDPDFDVYIRRAWERNDKGEIELFAPNDLSLEFLERQKETILNPKWYAAWYFQETHEQGLQAFPREKIKLFDAQVDTAPFHALTFPEPMILPGYARRIREDEEVPIAVTEIPVYCAIVIDPALTGGRKSDNWGVTVQAWDRYKNWFFLEAQEWRELPSRAGDLVIDLLRLYRPSTLLLETQNCDVEFVDRISRWIQGAQMDCVIRSYSALKDEAAGERGKDQRILSMEPDIRRNKFWVRRGRCGKLLKQLDAYPNLVHDDVIDSAAMGRKLAKFAPLAAYRIENPDDTEPEDLFHSRLDAMEVANAGPAMVPRGCWTGPFSAGRGRGTMGP